MRRELLTTASSSPGDAVPMELTAGTTTRSPASRIVNASIRLRIFSGDLVSGHLDRI